MAAEAVQQRQQRQRSCMLVQEPESCSKSRITNHSVLSLLRSDLMHMLACSSSAPLKIGSIRNTWLAKLQADGWVGRAG